MASSGTSSRLHHMPGLDGLRAVALLPVLCFHAGFAWVSGGYLPLTAFFVLSGFLITGLVLVERERTGRIGLVRFWSRRIRRLFPAAALGILLAGLYVATAGSPDQIANFRGDAAAALANVANWRFVLSDQVYAELFAQPSPLQHYWSLAVEEQFYLVFPLAVAGLLALGRGRRWALTTFLLTGVAVSVLAMRALHHPGDPPLRVYFGTDTRAAELLLGALLAMVLVGRDGLRPIGRRATRALDVAGLAALAATVVLWARVTEFDPWLYEGGLLVVALLAAVVVAAGAHNGTVTARLLGIAPLAGLGRISYGVYIFHWPVFLWMSEERTGLDGGPLFAVRMAATIALATASYHLVEQPVRSGRPLPRPVGTLAWANCSVGVVAVAALLAAPTATPTVTFRADGDRLPADPPPTAPAPEPVPGTTTTTPTSAPPPSTSAAPPPSTTAPTAAPPTAPTAPPAPPTTAAPTTVAPTTTAPPPAPPPPPPPPPPPLRVAVVGDSLAQNLAGGLDRWARQHGSLVVWDLSVQGCPTGRGGARLLQDGARWPVDPVCGWWATEGRSKMAEFRPDVVLVQTGHAEIFDRVLPQWGETPHRPGEEIFDQWLLGEYGAAVDVLASTGAQVVWSLPPCIDADRKPGFIDDDEGNDRTRHIGGTIDRALALSRPVALADLHALLCPDGEFTNEAMGVPNSRHDGWHLTDELADLVADRWLVPLLLDAAGRA